ncbi:IS5 family transposase, partial [Streptomyces misionensis]|uniref:IS5 family transposase n=1 Tax=Streptomyces misionensis TaxID=67331 RepID=UPI0036B98154
MARWFGHGAGWPDRCLRPFLPVSNRRCGRWRDHRQVIDGILHRVRTGVHWRDLPERFGPWKTVYERHRLWSADGTWERLLQQIQAEADAAGEIDWDVSVDSTIVRAHQHAAGARKPGSYSSQEGRAGRSCLVGQVFGVGEAGAVVQGGVQVGVSGAAPADRLPGGPIQRGQSRQAVADERVSQRPGTTHQWAARRHRTSPPIRVGRPGSTRGAGALTWVKGADAKGGPE